MITGLNKKGYILFEKGGVDFDQIGKRFDDFTGEAHPLVVDHVAKRSNNQRNQNRKLQGVRRGELRKKRAHRTTGLYLNQRMVVLAQALLECDEQVGEVVLVILGKVRGETLENSDATKTSNRI